MDRRPVIGAVVVVVVVIAAVAYSQLGSDPEPERNPLAEDASELPRLEPGVVIAEPDLVRPIDTHEEEPVDGRLVGESYRFLIEGFSLVDEVPLAYAGQTASSSPAATYTAAEGEQLLVVDVIWRSDPTPNLESLDNPPLVSLTLVVDGEARDVSQIQQLANDDDGVLVASVPEGAEDLEFVASEEVGSGAGVTEVEQHWSFTTQQRSGEAPELHYRLGDVAEVEVNEEAVLPFGVDVDETSVMPDIPFGEPQASISVRSAHLAYLVEYLPGKIQKASGEDRALLFLDASVDMNVGEFVPHHYAAPVEGLTVTLPDGTEVEAIRLAEPFLDHEDILGGYLVWDVPADLDHATVTLRPGRGPGSPTSEDTIDFRDGALTFDVDFIR